MHLLEKEYKTCIIFLKDAPVRWSVSHSSRITLYGRIEINSRHYYFVRSQGSKFSLFQEKQIKALIREIFVHLLFVLLAQLVCKQGENLSCTYSQCFLHKNQ